MSASLACDMTAIPADRRGAHHALTRRLMVAATSVRHLPDGLAFEWPAAEYGDVTRFINDERRCCPFLAFIVTISESQGPIDLRITGPEGTTAFLRAELHLD